MPFSNKAEVTTPVPPPSSMTKPLVEDGIKEAIRRPNPRELGQIAPTTRGLETQVFINTPKDKVFTHES